MSMPSTGPSLSSRHSREAARPDDPVVGLFHLSRRGFSVFDVPRTYAGQQQGGAQSDAIANTTTTLSQVVHQPWLNAKRRHLFLCAVYFAGHLRLVPTTPSFVFPVSLPLHLSKHAEHPTSKPLKVFCARYTQGTRFDPSSYSYCYYYYFCGTILNS